MKTAMERACLVPVRPAARGGPRSAEQRSTGAHEFVAVPLREQRGFRNQSDKLARPSLRSRRAMESAQRRVNPPQSRKRPNEESDPQRQSPGETPCLGPLPRRICLCPSEASRA